MSYARELADGSLIPLPRPDWSLLRRPLEILRESPLLRRTGPARTPRAPATGTRSCTPSVRKATGFKAYVDLVRQAELKLTKCGRSNLEDRLHILSGIYYATPWSLDFEVEKSTARNVAFQTFLAKRYSSADDPRPCLGSALFLSLMCRQDVAGVDMGHVMIGLSARMRRGSRDVVFPGTGSTGLEITTWVGDLAGASARLALDRIAAPSTAARKYFSGTDYGAASNLEGDVAAYLVGVSPAAARVAPPTIASSGLIATALENFFVKKAGFGSRCRSFLVLQGATFSGTTLTNRSSIHTRMADKFEAFGRLYMVNFQRRSGKGPAIIARTTAAAVPLLRKAAEDVAGVFLDKLVKCKF